MSTLTQPAGASLSSDELSEATRYLTSSREALVDQLTGLSDAQWNFSPGPDRWSIAENVEHLAIIEARIHDRIAELPTGPAARPDRLNSQIEQTILSQVPKRAARFQAPAPLCPSGQWPPEEALIRFLSLRDRTLELLTQAPCLRGHLFTHPALGDLDGYQWMLALAAHTMRHTNQIVEIKSSPGFPATTSAN